MVIICYFLGQKYYPIQYNLRKTGIYFVVAILMSVAMLMVNFDNLYLNTAWRLLLFVPFVLYVFTRELPVKQIIDLYLRKNATSKPT